MLIKWKQETGNRKQETGNRKQETGNRKQETGNVYFKKLLKCARKFVKAFVPYGLIWLKRRLIDQPKKQSIDQQLYLMHKESVFIKDPVTNAEQPLEEYNEVRNILKKYFTERYPEENINIGDFTYGDPIILNWNKNIKLLIGKYCSIAENVKFLLGGEHSVEWITTYPFTAFVHYFKDKGGEFKRVGNDILVGNDVWIGGDSKIMSGVKIGDGCIIGANSLIPKNKIIPDYTIWGGVPVKQIGQRFSDKNIKKLQEMKWWDWADKDMIKVIPILINENIELLIEYYENNIIRVYP
jgi:acetyltransferase-like isoleucine patch superfamily enzyme